MKKYCLFVSLTLVIALTSCSKHVTDPLVSNTYFSQWNECTALSALKDYVDDVTNPKSPNFIKVEDRIATFDMDGTFVGELFPTYFEYNLLEYRVLDDPAYRDKAPEDVRQTAQEIRDFVRNGKPLPDHFNLKHGRAAAKAYSGMTLAEFDAYVKAFAEKPANGFKGMTFGQGTYKPMLEIINSWFYVLCCVRFRQIHCQGTGHRRWFRSKPCDRYRLWAIYGPNVQKVDFVFPK